MTQNIKRIDHIAFMCRPDNHDKYVDKFEKLFEIVFDAEHDGVDMGLRYSWSWGSGLEILSPVGNAFDIAKIGWQFLEERGEGLFSIVMGVADINRAREHALSLGYQPRDVQFEPKQPWAARMQKCDQITIEKLFGIFMAFGEVITDNLN